MTQKRRLLLEHAKPFAEKIDGCGSHAAQAKGSEFVAAFAAWTVEHDNRFGGRHAVGENHLGVIQKMPAEDNGEQDADSSGAGEPPEHRPGFDFVNVIELASGDGVLVG